ncbi:hypothetical protein CROQUDRAFT_89547 [Cronartium quercuum f. sp. fusiforme G11]|uniref:Uncharacterized protein n=1 Tax=Cronartium quercuum f. sp. fusiforme G11 TaxID=708437 RepID=A0A9P6TEQ5_9BASI|nr:hypothetical protein CROQUDRAFT_89547 [Cronartium quercuum f. sp. fusiforme G11]
MWRPQSPKPTIEKTIFNTASKNVNPATISHTFTTISGHGSSTASPIEHLSSPLPGSVHGKASDLTASRAQHSSSPFSVSVHEEVSNVHGQKSLTSATPPISTLPMEVLAGIGISYLLLSCVLLAYKLVRDRTKKRIHSLQSSGVESQATLAPYVEEGERSIKALKIQTFHQRPLSEVDLINIPVQNQSQMIGDETLTHNHLRHNFPLVPQTNPYDSMAKDRSYRESQTMGNFQMLPHHSKSDHFTSHLKPHILIQKPSFVYFPDSSRSPTRSSGLFEPSTHILKVEDFKLQKTLVEPGKHGSFTASRTETL